MSVKLKQNLIPCQELNFLYIYATKCACTSLKQWIYQIKFQQEFQSHDRHGEWIHIHNCPELHQIDKQQLAKQEPFLNKITVIREPISRFISAYANRVIYYQELSDRVVYKDRLLEAGLKLNPDINYFVDNLAQYQELSDRWTILHHTRPLTDFIGKDLDIYTKIYQINEINLIRNDILAYPANSHLDPQTIPEIPKLQTGGPKLELNILTPKSFQKLVEYYATDYEILKDYYSRDRIQKQYRAS